MGWSGCIDGVCDGDPRDAVLAVRGFVVGNAIKALITPNPLLVGTYFACWVNGVWKGPNHKAPLNGEIEILANVDPGTDVASIWVEQVGAAETFDSSFIPSEYAEAIDALSANRLRIKWVAPYALTPVRGDAQLSSITVTGALRNNNVEAIEDAPYRGRLSYTITTVGGDYFVRWYANGRLVAEGSRSGDGALTCDAVNGSGLSVACTLAYTAEVTLGSAWLDVVWAKSYQIHYVKDTTLSFPRPAQAIVRDNGGTAYSYRSPLLSHGDYDYNVLAVDDAGGNVDGSPSTPGDSPKTITNPPKSPTITGVELVAAPDPVSGGSSVDAGGYRYRTLTADGSFVVTETVTVQRLVVAGGGGGGQAVAGGGGAGGYIADEIVLTPGTYAAVVGAGGAGESDGGNTYGANGSNSTFAGATAVGGGGGKGNGVSGNGRDGGSGGGNANWPATSGGAATSGQGHAGGSNDGTTTPNGYGGGGGGGAGAAGGTGNEMGSGPGGKGGAGLQWLDGNYYAGGGSGGAYLHGASEPPGPGGGGIGSGDNSPGANGTANTGGGGGGGGFFGTAGIGGNGGKGIVKIRYIVGTRLQVDWTNGESGTTAKVYYGVDGPTNYGQLSGPGPIGPTATNATSAVLDAIDATPRDNTSDYSDLSTAMDAIAADVITAFGVGETGFVAAVDTEAALVVAALDTYQDALGKRLQEFYEAHAGAAAHLRSTAAAVEGLGLSSDDWIVAVQGAYVQYLQLLGDMLGGTPNRYALPELQPDGTTGIDALGADTLYDAAQPFIKLVKVYIIVRSTKGGVEEMGDVPYIVELEADGTIEPARPNVADIQSISDLSLAPTITVGVVEGDGFEPAFSVEVLVDGSAVNDDVLPPIVAGYHQVAIPIAVTEGWHAISVRAVASGGGRSAESRAQEYYFGGEYTEDVEDLMADAIRGRG